MNLIGYYTNYMIDRAAYAVHKNSREAAAYLEAQDEKDFGKSNIEDLNGVRYSKVPFQDPHSWRDREGIPRTMELGVTAEKIKILQRLELQYAIAKKAEDVSKSSQRLGFFHALGSLITPTLRTGSTGKIGPQFCKEALRDVIPKRSKNCLGSEYSVADNEKYLAKEIVVQDEGTRLFDRIGDSSRLRTKWLSKDLPIQNAINNVAQDLVVNRVTNNGKALSAVLGLGTAALAWRYLSK